MITDVHKIQVLYRDRLAGTLQTDPVSGACVFEYDKQWLADGFALSPTELPLQSGLFFADSERLGGSFAIFEDSLPDGYGLYLLEKILRNQNASLKDLTPLQRLSIIGKSGMGALSYLPVMPGIQKQQELIDSERLDLLQEEALKILSEKEEGDASLLYYNSSNSGGARPKATLGMEDGSHWLVKFRHTYDPVDIGKQEWLYMNTAEECGVSIPRIKLLKDRYFAIERFDIGNDGQRLHVATAAALLKTDFRRQDVDYTNLLALTGYLTQDPVQVEEMFRRMVVNLVVDNKDDHAKNFSFICRDGRWELAPAYDITYSPAGSNGEHATSLFYNGNPGLDLVLKAGTGIRIPKSRCLEIIDTVEKVCEKRLPAIKMVSRS
ncbi:MAG: type II toxin-antitoxin system HipA family toxin [Bacteroidales bacterium]|nr:type II toxin-antitoxin system HipA family toxin [Bacteroidales bacterium]